MASAHNTPLSTYLPFMKSYMRMNQAYCTRPGNYVLKIWEAGSVIETRFVYPLTNSLDTIISTANLDPTGAGYYLIDTTEPYDPGTKDGRAKVASPSLSQMVHNAQRDSDGDDLVINVACVYDATERILTVYVNERVHWWHHLPSGLDLDGSSPMTIGSDVRQHSLTGRVYCTRFYDRALTHEEIVRLGNYVERVQHSKDPVMKLHVPYPIRISSAFTNHAEHDVVVNTKGGVGFTISFWARLYSDIQGGAVLFNMGDSFYPNADINEKGIIVYYEDPNKLRIQMGDHNYHMYRHIGVNAEEYFGMTPIRLNDGRPHHIVIRIDMYLSQITLFVDGCMFNISRAPKSRLPTFTNKLVFGKKLFDYRFKQYGNAHNLLPNAVFEDVRYYETALDRRTIRAIYERGVMHLKGRDASDLVYGSRGGYFADAADLCGYHCKTTCEFHRDPLALTCPPGEEAMCDLTPPPVIESAVRGPRLHPTMFGTFNLIDSGASSAPGLQFGFVNASGYPTWFANDNVPSGKMFAYPDSPAKNTESLVSSDNLKDGKALFSPQASTVRSRGAYDYGMVAFKHAPMYHYLFRMNVSANVGSATQTFLTPEFLKQGVLNSDPTVADLIDRPEDDETAWFHLHKADGLQSFDMSLMAVFEKRYYKLLDANGEEQVLLANGTYA